MLQQLSLATHCLPDRCWDDGQMKSFVLAGESELPEAEDDKKLRMMLFPAGTGFFIWQLPTAYIGIRQLARAITQQ